MSLSFFLVVLGGRTFKSNVELHDVRWVIGESIEDTLPELRKQWFGQKEGLHIDSYKCIKYIDGYKIHLTKINGDESIHTNIDNNYLWFVNLGGYSSEKMSELHDFSLVIAKTASEAKRKAKKNWVSTVNNKHNDDCSGIKKVEKIDNLCAIKEIKCWKINLIPDPQKRNQKLTPDWFGYMRIDNF